MSSASSIRLASLVAIVVLVASGFWLGAFAWFGGLSWLQQAFGWSALALSLCVVVLRFRTSSRRWPWHVLFFFVSQALFVASVAAGQVYYVGPSNLQDTISLFGSALHGDL